MLSAVLLVLKQTFGSFTQSQTGYPVKALQDAGQIMHKRVSSCKYGSIISTMRLEHVKKVLL